MERIEHKNQLKSIVKEYSNYLPIIIILFYILGFSYQFWYYSYFDIQIEYYVTAKDILFQSISNILRTIINLIITETALLFLSEFIINLCYHIGKKKKRRLNSKSPEFQKRFKEFIRFKKDDNRKFYSFTIIVLFPFIIILSHLSLSFYLPIVAPSFILGLYRITRINSNEEKIRMRNGLFIMFFVLLIATYSFWGYKDASKIKNSYSSKVIQIDDIYTGDGIQKFIGETSDYFFILNSQKNTVAIIDKKGTDKIKLEENKYYIEEMKKTESKIKGFEQKIKKQLEQFEEK